MDWLPDIVLLIHVFLAIVWLGCDLVVFSLSLSLLNRELPAVVRADRAHIAEVIDKYVLIAYILTIPVGALLAYQRGFWPITAIPWLMLKLALFGVIILLAIAILTGASGTTTTLTQIVAGEDDTEALEAKLRKGVIGMAPVALGIHFSIVAIIFIAITRSHW